MCIRDRLMALLWFIGGGKSFYRLFPFMILSYMHLLNKENEFTTDDEKSSDEWTMQNKDLLHLIAYAEMFIFVTLLLDTILLKTGSSGVLLVVYLGIYWLRLNFSPYAQITFLRTLNKFDEQIPAKHKNKWEIIKRFIYLKMKEHEKRSRMYASTA